MKSQSPKPCLTTETQYEIVKYGSENTYLHALLIHRKALKRQVPTRTIMRLDRPWQEKRTLHIQILHPILHHAQLERNNPRHLNSATERNLPITLTEVQIAHAEFRSGYMNLQERLGPARQIFDVAVAAVFGSTWYRTRTFLSYFLFNGASRGASVDILRLRRLGNDTLEFGGADEFGFAAVPFGQDFGTGSTAENPWVNEPREADTRYVPARTEDTLKVPDGFGAEIGRARLASSGWSLERGKAYALG